MVIDESKVNILMDTLYCICIMAPFVTTRHGYFYPTTLKFSER